MPTAAAPSKSLSPRALSAQALPDLRALEAFVTVDEAGSMALAAQRLGLSQSAVSQLVRALEADYGVELLDREVRPARPTRAGRGLLDLAAELIARGRAVNQQVRAIARQDYAQIRLGCVDSFAATLGPALVRALSGSASQLQLWSGLTPTLAAQLQARELDLAICTESGIDDPRIRQRLLFSEEWVAVFPRGHAVQRLKAARDLAALPRELPLIRYSRRSVIGQQIERYLLHLGLVAPRRFEFDATDPMLSLVAAGIGWALTTPLCLWQSRQYIDQVTVVSLPPARLDRREFFLLTRDGEWAGLDEEVARVTRGVLRRETVPALRRRVPTLARGAIAYPDGEA